MRRRTTKFLLVMAAAVLATQATGAQNSFSRGQNASPAFEGWEQNPEGSFNFLFGYMNRNWEEELDVPIGPDNNIAPGATTLWFSPNDGLTAGYVGGVMVTSSGQPIGCIINRANNGAPSNQDTLGAYEAT